LPFSQYTFIISGHGNEDGIGLFSRRIRFTELANSFKSFPVFPLTECEKQHQFDTRQQEITIDNTEQVITNKKFIPYLREFKLAFASQ